MNGPNKWVWLINNFNFSVQRTTRNKYQFYCSLCPDAMTHVSKLNVEKYGFSLALWRIRVQRYSMVRMYVRHKLLKLCSQLMRQVEPSTIKGWINFMSGQELFLESFVEQPSGLTSQEFHPSAYHWVQSAGSQPVKHGSLDTSLISVTFPLTNEFI